MKLNMIVTTLVLTVSAGAAHAADLPTAPFRKEHVEIKEHLAHLDTMAGALPAANADEQRRTMSMIAKFLDEHIRKHAEWEEAYLYPAVDKRTHGGPHPFTESMRYEHRIVGRSIEALQKMAGDPKSDPTAFARATDRLLGLIGAHFEEEEEVLLPILDQTMTKEEFEAELGPHAQHEKHEKH